MHDSTPSEAVTNLGGEERDELDVEVDFGYLAALYRAVASARFRNEPWDEERYRAEPGLRPGERRDRASGALVYSARWL